MRLLLLIALALLLSACGRDPNAALDFTYRLPAVAYNPYHRDDATCPTLADIQADFQRLHGVTDTVRIYGLKECNLGDAALAAATALGMQVNLGMWLESVASDGNTPPATAELQTLSYLLDTYGSGAVQAITVGNETQRTTTVPAATVLDTVSQVRALLAAKNMTIPVTTAQVPTDYTPELIAAVDFLLPNIHPYWAGFAAKDAAAWTVQTAQALATSAGKPVVLGETGWPSGGPAQNDAIPSPENAATYLQTWVCAAQDANQPYTYFEAYDATRSADQPDVEGHWGLLERSGALKSSIPDTIHCHRTSTK